MDLTVSFTLKKLQKLYMFCFEMFQIILNPSETVVGILHVMTSEAVTPILKKAGFLKQEPCLWEHNPS